MNNAPSRLPSDISIHNDNPSVMKRRTNNEVMRITLTFSIAFAPFQIARSVIAITRNWKKMTCVGDCRNEFQTSVVSTPSPVSPPEIPSWKYFKHHPPTIAYRNPIAVEIHAVHNPIHAISYQQRYGKFQPYLFENVYPSQIQQ